MIVLITLKCSGKHLIFIILIMIIMTALDDYEIDDEVTSGDVGGKLYGSICKLFLLFQLYFNDCLYQTASWLSVFWCSIATDGGQWYNNEIPSGELQITANSTQYPFVSCCCYADVDIQCAERFSSTFDAEKQIAGVYSHDLELYKGQCHNTGLN
ncbi:hypothetical protein FF38_14005 [Lucilia cuprina]|uniref:Uncharacterized protein n=1 Tax=Lucilia cuprina TaxID=7375 RepID=A0A0L0CJ89_LUCCU|nr:hypothetical protein FF38_14005 [Lucilia cuprina]